VNQWLDCQQYYIPVTPEFQRKEVFLRENITMEDELKTTKECFVIMPFLDQNHPSDNKWDDLFQIIKLAVEQTNLGYICQRSLNPHGNFMHDIVNHLANADIVIAILTELRPNVMYELGVRHALKRKTIMLAEEGTPIPSDLNSFIALCYSVRTQGGREHLASIIRDRVILLNAEEPTSDNPVSDYLLMRAQKVCDEWYHNRNLQSFIVQLTEVLPSYALRLGRLLNQISYNLTYTKSEETIRSLATESVITEIAQTLEEPPDERTREKVARILSSTADKAIDTIRQTNLTIDSTPLLGVNGESWQLPYHQFLTVSDLLDNIWFTLPNIPAMAYGVRWALRDATSGRRFEGIGRRWAKNNLGRAWDDRSLSSIGIEPGMKLEVIPI
jgi:nucleoside 2-deoxyribosyltransferase